MRRPRLAVSLAALLLAATTAACSSDDARPAYAYSAGPRPKTSTARLPAPSRRVVAAPYVPPPTSPRRGST